MSNFKLLQAKTIDILILIARCNDCEEFLKKGNKFSLFRF